MIEEVDISSCSVILDVGCGTGNYATSISRITGAHVYGIDASEGMLEQARSKKSNVIF